MPLLPLLPLALDIGTLIQAIIFLVVLFSGVAKMFMESKEVQKQARQAPARRPRPKPKPQQARLGNAPNQSEVDEFLRRVGEQEQPPRRGTAQPKPQAAPGRARQPRIELVNEDEAADAGFDIENRPRQQRRTKPKARKPLAASERPKPNETRNPAEPLGSRDFAERASHLGEAVAKADDRFESRLTRKFDHNVGTLADRHLVAETPAPDQPIAPHVAADIAALLATPTGMRQAIVLNEVLTRPVDRWT